MKRKVEYWQPNKKLLSTGGADYAIFFPKKVMKAMGWEKGEVVELFITPDEIRIERKKEQD